MRTYDAIVVGAGHNGLTTAAFLARAGLDVVCVEKNDYIGGAAVSRNLYKDWIYSNCSYVCSLLRPEIFRELELHRHGLQVTPYGGAGDLLGAGDRLAALDPAALRAEAARLAGELEVAERRRTELAEHKGKLDQEIESLGGDRAARLGAEAESLLADLGDQVERYVLVHLAHKILDTVTDRHAREGQPAILAHTSQLLARITDGRHVRVVADRQASALVVHDALGHARSPRELSTGAREQLFLALRLAHVVDYCDRAEPLPVIIDDVLVNFDRGRARSTIEALLEVSRVAQVLLFTCHDHIVDLVREVAPKAPVLALPRVDPRAAAVDAVSLRAAGDLGRRALT